MVSGWIQTKDIFVGSSVFKSRVSDSNYLNGNIGIREVNLHWGLVVFYFAEL